MVYSDKKMVLISIAIIIVLGFAAYGNSLNGAFLWDDDHLVKNNFYIRDWANTGKIFSGEITTKKKIEKSVFYRPLQIVTYMADYAMYKMNTKGYHVTNVLLHISVALALYWLIKIISGDVFLALLTSVFFIAHPVHTEAVSYISGRSDPLSAVFMLLCFCFYLKGVSSGKVNWIFPMVLTYVLALLSREFSLVLIVLMLLYHASFRKKIKPMFIMPLAGIAIFYGMLRLTLLKELVVSDVVNTTFFQRLPGFFVAIANYMRILVLPINLHMEYGNGLFRWFEPMSIVGASILVILLFYAFSKRKKNAIVFFSISWFLVALLPVSNLYPINAYMAEHWLYLPSIGVFLLLSKGLISLYNREDLRLIAICIASGLLIVYVSLTFRQNTYWSKPIVFYEEMLKYVPNSWTIHNNLGIAYKSQGRIADAVTSYEKAIEINPYQAGTYNNLGNTYLALGENEKAIIAYKKAIGVAPNFTEAYGNLGVACAMSDRQEDAISFYEKAIELNPRYIQAYCNLAKAYFTIGDRKKAIDVCEEAIKINPQAGMLYFSMAIIYYNEKKYDLSIEYCDKAIERGTNVPTNLLKQLEPYRKNKK